MVEFSLHDSTVGKSIGWLDPAALVFAQHQDWRQLLQRAGSGHIDRRPLSQGRWPLSLDYDADQGLLVNYEP